MQEGADFGGLWGSPWVGVADNVIEKQTEAVTFWGGFGGHPGSPQPRVAYHVIKKQIEDGIFWGLLGFSAQGTDFVGSGVHPWVPMATFCRRCHREADRGRAAEAGAAGEAQLRPPPQAPAPDQEADPPFPG